MDYPQTNSKVPRTTEADPFEQFAASSVQGVRRTSLDLRKGATYFKDEICYSGACYSEVKRQSGGPTLRSGDPKLKQRYLAEQKEKDAKSQLEQKRWLAACDRHEVSACVQGLQALPPPAARDRLKKQLCAEPRIRCRTLTYPQAVQPEAFPGEKTLFTSSADYDDSSEGEPARPEREIFYVTTDET